MWWHFNTATPVPIPCHILQHPLWRWRMMIIIVVVTIIVISRAIIVIVVIRYELELAPTASDLCQGYVMLNLFHPSQPKLCLFQTSPNIRLNLAYGLVALIL